MPTQVRLVLNTLSVHRHQATLPMAARRRYRWQALRHFQRTFLTAISFTTMMEFTALWMNAAPLFSVVI